ncbi:hypothetical protein DCAR_0206427 [Daucus carota subsp. sativus]|uniref:Uncharacterized protein n=1 Tax=Daucus carota subsp. sativus TaxID=79200 RepID=A0A169WNH3_DAUCS|nr:hypothetical protein DCAR_0206427 [Daucus carota subsp. sativus]
MREILERERVRRENFSNFQISKPRERVSDLQAQHHQWFKVVRDNRNGKRKYVPLDTEREGNMKQSWSYADAVRSTGSNPVGSIRLKEKIAKINCLSVMIVNLPLEATVKDIWLYFNKQRNIKDIVLPKRRDRNNNRIGFLIVESKKEVEYLITSFNGRRMGRNHLVVKMAQNNGSRAKMQQSENNSVRKGEELGDKAGNTIAKPQNGANHECMENLVTQPSFRTIVGKVDDEFKDILGRSLVGITKEIEWADSIQEKIIGLGCSFIRVRGISHKSFLLTMEEDIFKANVNIEFLYEIFTGVYKATHSDLIVPRLAWLDCDGLPISVWNNSTWSSIIADWGYLVTENNKPLISSMFSKLKLCIATCKVERIKETLKVVIDGEGYWVTIQESGGLQEELKGWTYNSLLKPDKEIWNQENVSGIYKIGENGLEEVKRKNKDGERVRSPTTYPDSSNKRGADSVEKPANDVEDCRRVLNDPLVETVNEVVNSLAVEENEGINENLNSLPGGDGKGSNEHTTVEEVRKNIWQVRDKNTSLSSLSREEESIKILDSEETDFVGVTGSSCLVNERFLNRVGMMNIGKKRGRPRKHSRVYNFMKVGMKKKTGNQNKVKESETVKTVKKKGSTAKEARKKLRLDKLNETEHIDIDKGLQVMQEKDLALQVLEAGELMGLVAYKDREETLERIRLHLED